MAGHVERGDLPGLVMLVSRHGEVQVDAIGRLAFEGSSMTRDAIFRITSMTKPVTAAAAMILVEEGRLHLDDAPGCRRGCHRRRDRSWACPRVQHFCQYKANQDGRSTSEIHLIRA